MSLGLSITVGATIGGIGGLLSGRWQQTETLPGDIEMSFVWPGCCDELSWTPGNYLARKFVGGEIVTVNYGPLPVWAGTLVEPDASQDRLVAQGLWRLGENFAALGNTGNPAKVPDTFIDQAIARGLQWIRPNSISAASIDIDTSGGPSTVGASLDTYADNNGLRWGVSPTAQVYAQADPTVPTYQTLPQAGGNGFALDNYASALIARYLDSTTSTFKTLPAVTNAAEIAAHGRREQILDLSGRGAISAATATTITTNVLALSHATPQWTAPISLSYGEILSMGGVPVALETVTAGVVLRIHGGYELAQRLNGAMYLDILIGRTNLAGGVLTIQPIQVASRNLTDVLADALEKH